MKHSRFLEDLARLPAMTKDQAAQLIGINRAALDRFLRTSKSEGFITISTELVRERDSATPIAIIKPGDPLPSAGQIAYRVQTLWQDTFSPTVVIRATTKLQAIYGGAPHTIVTGHLSHEIALVDVLLKKRQLDPEFDWTLITARPGKGNLSDAISASGEVQIEILGRYNAEMVAGKIALSAKTTIELW